MVFHFSGFSEAVTNPAEKACHIFISKYSLIVKFKNIGDICAQYIID